MDACTQLNQKGSQMLVAKAVKALQPFYIVKFDSTLNQ